MKLKNSPLAAVIASMAMAASSQAAITIIATDGFNTGATVETPWTDAGTVTAGNWTLTETTTAAGLVAVGNKKSGYDDAILSYEGTGEALFQDASGSLAATLTETVGEWFNAGDKVAIDFFTRSRATTGSLGLTVSLVGAATLNYASTYTPASSTWAQSTTEYVTIDTAGTYSVRFANATTGSDNTTMLDSVSYYKVDAIPEPSAALLGGLGMLCLLRRRRA